MGKNLRNTKVLKVLMVCFLSAVLGLSGLSAKAQDSNEFYKQAIGGRFGAANGITYKHFINDQGHAIDGILNFQGNRKYGVFKLVGLYQIHNTIPALDYQGLRWYYGAGGGLGFYNNKEFDESKVALSVDGVIGIDFKIPNTPVNLALDWKPMLELSPNAGMKFDGFGLSVRFVLF
jgi:hypothetical protein